MKKRVLTFVLTMLMLLPTFTACSENAVNEETANNDAVATTTPEAGEEAAAETVEELSDAEARLAIPDDLPD